MRSAGKILGIFLIIAFMACPLANASETQVLNSQELTLKMVEREADDDALRAGIRTLLERPEVSEAASLLGHDANRLADRVETLEGEALTDAAARAAAVQDALVGSDSVIIISSTTLIIILLLILILA